MGCCIRKQFEPSQGTRRNSLDLTRDRFQLNSILDLESLDLDLVNIESNGRSSPSWISFQSELGSQKQVFLEDDSSCPICVNNFDEVSHIPRILPCGHTMCNVCVMKMTKSNNYKYLRCPQDRRKHRTKFMISDLDDGESVTSDISGSFRTTSINNSTFLPVIPVTRHNHMYQSSEESMPSSGNTSDVSNSDEDSFHTDMAIHDRDSIHLENINIHPRSTQENVVSTWNSERQNLFYQSDEDVLTVSSRNSYERLRTIHIPRINDYSESIAGQTRIPTVPTFVSNLWSSNLPSESSQNRSGGLTTTLSIQEPLPDYSSDEALSGTY